MNLLVGKKEHSVCTTFIIFKSREQFWENNSENLHAFLLITFNKWYFVQFFSCVLHCTLWPCNLDFEKCFILIIIIVKLSLQNPEELKIVREILMLTWNCFILCFWVPGPSGEEATPVDNVSIVNEEHWKKALLMPCAPVSDKQRLFMCRP